MNERLTPEWSRPSCRGVDRNYCLRLALKEFRSVAPHAGAWIETPGDTLSTSEREVAPHAGAWIETSVSSLSMRLTDVAPHAGAWIETGERGVKDYFGKVAPHAG